MFDGMSNRRRTTLHCTSEGLKSSTHIVNDERSGRIDTRLHARSLDKHELPYCMSTRTSLRAVAVSVPQYCAE